ncbi:MAG TPA: Hpt domain-containing protein [Edaphobacter sp.]|nr:Hpt domain-containing protein [Edaphobacter sp.]
MTLPMNPDDEAKISALLTSLWERNLPLLHERLEILDRAASEAASGRMSETLRAEALEIAHKLSGSLGMFGYPHGTEIARQIEQILKRPAVDGSSDLTALTVELRQTLLGK